MADRFPQTIGRVLVVDDDSAVRSLFCAVLADAGFDVSAAVDGASALDALENEHVDVLLLDGLLPDMDGLAVLRRVRARPSTRTLPVILVTGRDRPEERVAGLDAGADDYVAKPVDVDELLARVRAQVRGARAWAEQLDGALRTRAEVAEALCGVDPSAGIEQVAADICSELDRLADVGGSAVVAAAPDGRLLALAATGAARRFDVGRPLSREVSAELLRRLDNGHARANGLASTTALARTAVAPLRNAGELIGALVVVPAPTAPAGDATDAPARLCRVTAAALDCAPVAAALLAPGLRDLRNRMVMRADIAHLLDPSAFSPVYQPIVDLASGEVVAHEALTRFNDGTPPLVRFAQAQLAGMGGELEATTLARALAVYQDQPDGALSINVSPRFVASEELRNLLAPVVRPVIVELTEHDPVDDYGALRRAVSELGPEVSLSVDDAGAGYATLQHILRLEPRYVKLDRAWVAGIDADPARQALVASLALFSSRLGCTLVAEGIERTDELNALRVLGVGLGQGFLLGVPAAA